MWQDVFEKIQRLKSLDKNFVMFGAEYHKYRFRQTISTAELARAEERLGATLPDELRNIYLELGNGGVGPDYGLFSVKELESVRPNSKWMGIDVLKSRDFSMDSLSGVIAVMDRYYSYRSYVVCNADERGQVIAFEEDSFVFKEAGSLHEVYLVWLQKELSLLNSYIAAMRSTTDMCLIATTQFVTQKIHPENSLLICASLLGMKGFTLAHAQDILQWDPATNMPILGKDTRARFSKAISNAAPTF